MPLILYTKEEYDALKARTDNLEDQLAKFISAGLNKIPTIPLTDTERKEYDKAYLKYLKAKKTKKTKEPLAQ